MLENIWHPSYSAAEYLGITEIKLSHLRENGFFKPGIHWKSSPLGQKKPWNPEVLYNSISVSYTHLTLPTIGEG